jgi:hypothetical protein
MRQPMSANKSGNAIFIICAALLMGEFLAAGQIPQAQDQKPLSDDVRRQPLDILERQGRGIGNSTQTPQPNAAAAQGAPASLIPPPSDSGPIIMCKPCANDLPVFIRQVAGKLGIVPLIVDPEIKGTVNVVDMPPMTKDDVFSLFLLVLKNNNAALTNAKLPEDKEMIYRIFLVSGIDLKGIPIIEKLSELSTPKSEPKESPVKTGD